MDELEPVRIPIDGVLDLHTFQPREVKDLLGEYITACRAKGICKVRVTHGKGTGALRQTVHAVLRKMPEVISFSLAGEFSGSWGATIALLRPLDKPPGT
jgi:DNA-nicking Smr family endonuclease